MADFSWDDVNRGIQDGFAYAEGFGIKAEREALTPQLGILENSLRSWEGELSGRFVALFATNFTVATIARAYYRDDALTGDELDNFLGAAVGFFNSWRHR